MEARMKTHEARTSCSPPSRPVVWPCAGPPSGKAGESIQISRGTVAMRLTVMELGRFMGLRFERRATSRTAACTAGFGVPSTKGDGSSPQPADNSILSYPRTGGARVLMESADAAARNAVVECAQRVPLRAGTAGWNPRVSHYARGRFAGCLHPP